MTAAESKAEVAPPIAKLSPQSRPRIAFFDYADVFEDFYPHYGVDQRTFATRWAGSSNHAFLELLQREVGDVIWYAQSLTPTIEEERHEVVGCKVKMLPSSCVHRWLWRAFYLPRMAWRWRGAYRAFAMIASYLAPLSLPLLRKLRSDRPDVFFVQSYSSGRYDMLLLIARALHVPLIVYHAGGKPEGYLGKLAKRWTIPRADRLIASGKDELEMLATRYGVSREQLVLILTPIDTAVYCPMDRRAVCTAAALDPDRRYILFVGRLEDEIKRVSAIIQAFSAASQKHPDVDLLIVGDGTDGEKLRQTATEHAPGCVRFLGWVSAPEAKAQLYNAAECLVLASWREGFPTVVGEAMACGTPVLSSKVGGVAELVTEDQTGWLFKAGDDAALAERFSYVMANPKVITSMRSRVRTAAVERVSPSVVGAALKECFAPFVTKHG